MKRPWSTPTVTRLEALEISERYRDIAQRFADRLDAEADRLDVLTSVEIVQRYDPAKDQEPTLKDWVFLAPDK